MKKRLLFAVSLSLVLALTLGMSVSASQAIQVSGKMAWAGPPTNFVEKQIGAFCFISTDLPYQFYDGNLEGFAETHWWILSKGPCGAVPNQYKGNLNARGTFTGTLDGKEGTLDFLITMRVWPADPGELADIGKITILSGTGELDGLHGVLDVTYYMGDPGDTYSGVLHLSH